jgi:multiple sugar transport system ATP-binding protein
MTMGTRIVVMRDGMIQQADVPNGLYERPANAFVAGFIGMPAMNQIDADLVCDDDKIELVFNGISIRLPDRFRTDALLERNGKKVILGIRPEALISADRKKHEPDWPAFEAVVDIVEKLGSEAYLTVTAGSGLNLTVRAGTDAELPAAGSRIAVAFDPDRIHLFDHDSGRAISWED